MAREHSFPHRVCAPQRSTTVGEASDHAPRQNRILAALPGADYDRLLPALAPVALSAGMTLHSPGSRESYAYFPTSGIVARFHVMANGASAAFAVTGNEGVVGITTFLSGETSPTQAVVLCAGRAYRVDVAHLQREFEQGGALRDLLLRYIRALIAHTGQIAVCNRHHAVSQQLCRWMLSCVDRLHSGDLPMTQELIAEMLGVRRVSVTGAAGNLQREGVIHCGRGHIAVLDRAALEARTCECYAVVRQAYDDVALRAEQ
jgi:CRP-like cAMP-binding protein